MIPNVLTIAGTDPTGGAGVQADLKTFSALGAYGMSVITAVVAQNTLGVRGVVPMDPGFVADQIEAVFDDVRVDALKIGMVANAGIAEAISDALDAYAQCPVVIDPVMVAKSGDRLVDEEAIDMIRHRLLPGASVVTPNLPEAAVLLGRDDEWSTPDQMHRALPGLQRLGVQWVLLKGGHLPGASSVDLLAGEGRVIELPADRIATTNDHGTGCTLSAAITALLPAHDIVGSVRLAKRYLTSSLAHADELDVGSGHGPVHHFHAAWVKP